MTKALGNPKLFAATGVLFALATLFNLSTAPAEKSGASLTLAPQPVELSSPVLNASTAQPTAQR